MKKSGPENIKTRQPLVKKLQELGWDIKQMRYEPEWGST